MSGGAWEMMVGLEVHAQMATRSKIFSPAPAAFCAEPNQHVREVDGGMPGALPSLNREAVRCAVMFGLAAGARVNPLSEFARKNYFYPDLPKGYQISQFDRPIVSGGQVALPDGKIVGITRAHLEEDAGKLLHDAGEGSGVDLNRAGVPLLEIVSEPDMRSSAEASQYAKTLHHLVRWLGVCDGNMQEGSFRIDANVSLRRPGAEPGVRCEIKNLNSFRFLEQALEYEASRQAEVLEAGGAVAQETRLFDPGKGVTRAMRGKEDAHDYRYFPDPDLPPLAVSEEWIEEIRSSLPELPDACRERFRQDLGLSDYDARALTASRDFAAYFESVLGALCEMLGGPPAKHAKLCANWACGELSALLNKHGAAAAQSRVSPPALAGLLRLLSENAISAPSAKAVLEKMWDGGGEAADIVEKEGLRQISDPAALEKIAAEVVARHPKQAEEFRAGKEKLLGFFVGQVMKETGGRADPARAGEIVKRILG